MADKPRVRVYGSEQCSYCLAERMLLQDKGIDFEDVPVGGDPEMRRKMEAAGGGRTVPQIFIDGEPIGGFDELYVLEKSGDLDKMLGID